MIQLEQVGVFLPQGFLYKDVTVQINDGDRIGLVGKNGAGKSTMMKILSGELLPSEGKIHKPKDTVLGYLSQDIKIDENQTVFNFLDKSNAVLTYARNRIDEITHQLTVRTDYESDGYMGMIDELTVLNDQLVFHEEHLWEEKISNTLKGLGFIESDFGKMLHQFSGGWKMRAELARILVNKPDVILLDEPTNHLDIVSIAWLENYLIKYSGIVIVISHDRLFLDNVTKRTLEISNGNVLDFPYAYSRYKEVRAEELERQGDAKKQQDKEIKNSQELIDKFRAKKNKAAFAQSLIKKLDKMERIEVENDAVSGMKIKFPLSVQPGKVVLNLEGVSKSYPDKDLFKDVSIGVGRGEKIALLGPNGVGKSTLLKRIMKTLEGPGTVEYGHNVHITYFAQDQAEQLDVNLSVYETVDKVAIGEVRKELRSILGAFLFFGETIDKKVAVLSGGERARLALCQLLLSPSNLLILDEPTNHLDMQSKDVLKQALIAYEGTFLVVSHDREFLDGLTNRIWDIENQALKIHHFLVSEYLERKVKLIEEASSGQKKSTLAVKNEVVKEKIIVTDTPHTKQEKTRISNAIKKSEDKIASLEADIFTQDTIMLELDYTNASEVEKANHSYENLKMKLDTEMSNWETLVEQLDSLTVVNA